MGISNKTSEPTRKFVTIILCIAAILIIFAAVIGLWIIASKPSPTDGTVIVPNSTDTTLAGVPARYDSSLPGQAVMDNSTYLSMIGAASAVMSNDTGMKWAKEHPDCQLYQADASQIDAQGLSYRWSLIFKSTGAMLLANVVDGRVTYVQPQDVEGLQVPPADQRKIYDSNYVMGIVAENLNTGTQAGNMLFSLEYLESGSGVYHIVYHDPSGQTPVELRIDASTGKIIESKDEGQPGGQTP